MNIKKIIAYPLASVGYQITKIKKENSVPLLSLMEDKLIKPKSKKSNRDKEFEFISELPGFLDKDAYGLFCELGKCLNKPSSSILEIGIFCGKSFLALGMAFKQPKHVVGVDPFYEDFKDSPVLEDEGEYLEQASNFLTSRQRLGLLEKAIENSNKYRPGLGNKFKILQITQDEFLKNRPEKFDVVHIDGEHTFRAVFDFFDSTEKVLNPEAFVVVDDFLNPGFPGISEAVHTHPLYKKQLVPIFYGFNKAVFIYKPRGNQAALLLTHLIGYYKNEKKAVRLLGDGSVTIQ